METVAHRLITAHNIGIAASGAGHWNFGCLHRCTLVPADEYLFGFLLLTSTLYFQLGSGSGLDVIKYPTCSNTCPLPAIMLRPTFYFIVLLSFFLGSCKPQEKPKYIYYGLADALKEKNPENVLRLSFINSKLDSIPEEIKRFANLIELDFSHNNLKSVPAWLNQFKKLQSLDLRVNSVDTLYPSFFELQSLEDLDIRDNKLKHIPPGFGKLKRLKSLNLGANDLSDLPNDFSGLDSLSLLLIDLNNFKSVPDVIFNLKSMENLHLYHNNISEISDSISKLTRLRQLTIDNNNLTNAQILHLKKILPNCVLDD